MRRGRTLLRALAGVTSVAAAVTALPAPATAARHPLRRVVEKIQASGPGFVIETDPQSGDATIRYDDGSGRWHSTLYVTANKLEVTVAAAVGETPDGSLRFEYRLMSSPGSRQRAGVFMLEFAGPVVDVTAPAAWRSFAMSYMPALDWFSVEGSRPGLAPGESTAGFSFQANPGPNTRRLAPSRTIGTLGYVSSPGSLPGIVRCYVLGNTPPLSFPTEAPDRILDALPKRVDQGLAGSTIGPVEIPESDTLGTILTSMDGSVKQSLELGWIERQETAGRYAETLAEVRKLLTAGAPATGAPGPAAAKAIAARLRTLAAQVEKDAKGGAITSEAQALLAFNARYLLARLAESR